MDIILLLEDEESVNLGITFTLQKEGYTIFSASSISEAEKLFHQHKPQLVICDITLPDGNGLDFVKKIRRISNAHIICLTALDQEIDQVMGYEAGTDDYITKPFSLSVLTLKIGAYFNKHNRKNREMIQSGNIRFHLQELRIWKDGKEIFLAKNEWKMLQIFLENPKQILSKEQLLQQLFGIDSDFVDDNTIAVNIGRLRKKIEEDSANPEYIKNIRGIGYIWDKDCMRI